MLSTVAGVDPIRAICAARKGTCGSSVLSVQANSTMPGRAKQAKLSTCPFVSVSLYSPFGSQSTWKIHEHCRRISDLS